MAGNPVHVLLVEDDEVDAEAVRRSFEQYKIGNPLTIVGNGVEALEALRGENGRERVSRPYLVLLDLNMPRMGGLEFLRELRQDPELEASVVFVLTTSHDEHDMATAYNNHVAGYILKSRVGEHFLGLPDMMQKYWRIVEFPNNK